MGLRIAAALREKEKRVAEAKEKGLGNFKSLAQKKALRKNSKDYNYRKKVGSMIKCKKVVKEYLKTNNLKETAKIVGLSEVQTSRYLKSDEASRTLAEALENIGFGKDEISKTLKNEFLDYNKQRVIRSYGEGMNAREVEEMRDGRLAFNALQFAAKYIEADANTIAQTGAGEVSSDIAMLAIKNLITKLDEKQLRVVAESIDALLENKTQVVSSQ